MCQAQEAQTSEVQGMYLLGCDWLCVQHFLSERITGKSAPCLINMESVADRGVRRQLIYAWSGYLEVGREVRNVAYRIPRITTTLIIPRLIAMDLALIFVRGNGESQPVPPDGKLRVLTRSPRFLIPVSIIDGLYLSVRPDRSFHRCTYTKGKLARNNVAQTTPRKGIANPNCRR
jgi:hypothetical protein